MRHVLILAVVLPALVAVPGCLTPDPGQACWNGIALHAEASTSGNHTALEAALRASGLLVSEPPTPQGPGFPHTYPFAYGPSWNATAMRYQGNAGVTPNGNVSFSLAREGGDPEDPAQVAEITQLMNQTLARVAAEGFPMGEAQVRGPPHGGACLDRPRFP